jgi:hypothetical protein
MCTVLLPPGGYPTAVNKIPGVQLKSGEYFNVSNVFTKIYNMLYYTTKLYLQ